MEKSIKYHTNRQKYLLKVSIFLGVLLLLLFFISLSFGSVAIPPGDIFRIFFDASYDEFTWKNIILTFRLPKALTSILVGASLAVSGLQMQTLFKNPLAGPFVLGVSAGASLGVALLVLAGGVLTGLGLMGSWGMVTAASLGSAAVLLLILFTSLRLEDSMTLLIVGLMFGSFAGAFVSVLQYFSKAEQIQAYLIWTFGSLGNLSWKEIYIFFLLASTGLIISGFLAKSLDTLLLGERYAKSMGVSIRRMRLWVIIGTSILAGTTTAFCGPIAFIGIAVPHLVRMLFDTSNHKVLIPLVMMGGAIFMLTCDIIAQLPGRPETLPVNAVTALLGAPVVIWVILYRRNFKNTFGS